MFNAKIDFSKNAGKVKPMHAVNNGPVGSNVRGTSNEKWFRLAGIPYARTHDSALSAYCCGGEFVVDIHRIFRDFNADVNDPKSYDFVQTDKYIGLIQNAGCETFYRLGASIEHEKRLAPTHRRIFRNGQKYANILSCTITKAGQMDLNMILNTGKYGTNRIVLILMAPHHAGKAHSNSLWSFL